MLLTQSKFHLDQIIHKKTKTHVGMKTVEGSLWKDNIHMYKHTYITDYSCILKSSLLRMLRQISHLEHNDPKKQI